VFELQWEKVLEKLLRLEQELESLLQEWVLVFELQWEKVLYLE
jgi:hypothetical protein